MQSAWAIGYGLAALVSYVVQDVLGLGWRAVFFVGILPALYTFWVRRNVEEPAVWRDRTRREDVRLGRAGDRRADARHHDRADAHERLHDVRVVGLQHLGAVLPARRHRALERGDELVHRRHAGRDVARVRDVRVPERSLRAEAHLRELSHRGRRAGARVHVDVESPGALRARARDGVLRDRLLQRLRRRDRGAVPDRRPRDRAGIHLQHRPRGERRGAMGRRQAHRYARLRRRRSRSPRAPTSSPRSSGRSFRRRATGSSHEIADSCSPCSSLASRPTPAVSS